MYVCRTNHLTSLEVERFLTDLRESSHVREVGHNRWMRMQQDRKLELPKRRKSSGRSSRSSADVFKLEREAQRLKHEFQLVAHVPQLEAKRQPTIAIVTLLYAEKMAVDAAMEFKTTYIRIKQNEGALFVVCKLCTHCRTSQCTRLVYLGEGLVYTVGKIEGHWCVATKLPRIGHGQGATLSAGNNITRLLGSEAAQKSHS